MSGSQQAVLVSAAGGEAAPGNIDSYTADLWAAYGLHKLLTAYAGPAIKVRRSNDDATQDIGFSGNALDTAALATFVSSNSAYIDTAYDQSGGGNDISQSTTTLQPRIVNVGVYDGFMRFDGSDDYLVSVNTSGGAIPAITTAFRGLIRSNTSCVLVEKSADINEFNGFYVAPITSGAGVLRMGISDPKIGSDGQFVLWDTTDDSPTVEGKWVVRYDRSQSTASNYAAWFRVWRNAIEQGRNYASISGTVAGTAFADNAYYVGARSGAVAPSPANLKTLLIYHASKDADVAGITAAL